MLELPSDFGWDYVMDEFESKINFILDLQMSDEDILQRVDNALYNTEDGKLWSMWDRVEPFRPPEKKKRSEDDDEEDEPEPEIDDDDENKPKRLDESDATK